MAKQIVSYFLRNPQAADSLEGIARWRLLEEQIHQSVRMTKQAVQRLVEMELLVAEHSEISGTLYRLNEKRRDEAEKFLKSEPTPGKRRGRRGNH